MPDETNQGAGGDAGSHNASKAVKAVKPLPNLLDGETVRRSLKSHVRAVRDAYFLPTGSKEGARQKVLLKNTVLRADQLHEDDAHAMIESGDLEDFDPAPAASIA